MTDDDLPAPPDEESAFLIALWAHLDAAEALSVDSAVMRQLDQVLAHCEAAAALIRRWQAGR